MILKFQYFLVKLILLIFCLTPNIWAQNTATAINLSKLLPRILRGEYELTPKDNKYFLRITLPNGSVREDVVKFESLNSDGTGLVTTVKASYDTVYDDRGTVSKVVYELPKNGSYIYKIRYYKEPIPADGVKPRHINGLPGH